MEKMSDFKVDTNGQCFLCMGKISPPISSVKREPESDLLMNPPLHSLQHLSRYLRMDMRKVFDEEVVVPPELLAKVEKARLKVELCRDCVCLNETFSKLYRQLEKIEMEMASQLNKIHIKLLQTNPYLGTDPDGSFNGKHKITEALRNEAKQKCFHKRTAARDMPRVKIRKSTLQQVYTERHKIKSNFLIQQRGLKTTVSKYSSDGMQPETMEGRVKEEFPTGGTDLEMEPDDARNDYFDDHFDEHEDPGLSSSHISAELTTSKTDPSVLGAVEVEKYSTGNDDSTTASKYKIEAGLYKCTVCSKKFKDKSKWKRHYEIIHLNVKYKCNVCGKEFVTRDNYKRHHQSVHIGMKFKCLVCDKPFTQKFNLASHQRKGDCKADVGTPS